MGAGRREEEREEGRVRMQINKVWERTLSPPAPADPCFTDSQCSPALCTPATWATALPSPILSSARCEFLQPPQDTAKLAVTDEEEQEDILLTLRG